MAALGIYGAVSWSVAQRRREVGLRIALGALRADVVQLMVRQTLTLVGIGLGCGLVLAVLFGVALARLPFDLPILYGVRGTDAATLGGVTALLVLVALVACGIPAARASRVDPATSLRNL